MGRLAANTSQSVLFHHAASLCVVFVLSGQFPEAHADLMQLSFSGKLTGVSSALAPYFSAGQDFQGTVLFDSSVANTSTDPMYGLYPAISNATLQVGGYQISKNSGTSTVYVGMNLPFFSYYDVVDLTMNSPLYLSGSLGGFIPDQFQLKLISGAGGTGFADTSITNMYSASPSQYQYQYMSVSFWNSATQQSAGIAMNNSSNAFFTTWNVTPASSPVPEIDPAGLGSVLALVTGALGLLERRRAATT